MTVQNKAIMPPDKKTMRRNFAISLLAVAVILPVAVALVFHMVAPKHQKHLKGIVVQENLVYGPDPVERLDICVPSGDAKNRPALVLIHGGGWEIGNRQKVEGWCRFFAYKGVVVANIDYRLVHQPNGKWPAQLQDAQLATRWFRRRAAQYHVDPAHICAGGDSAGGQLALFLATLPHIIPGDRAADLPDVSPQVACAVDNFGPIALPSLLSMPTFQRTLHLLATDTTPSGIDALARSMSPITLVGPNTPPVIIAHGETDTEVPPEQSVALHQALVQAHVPTIYLTFPGGHEFKDIPQIQIEGILELEAAFIRTAPPLPH